MKSCSRSILLVLLSLSTPVYVISKSYDSCDGNHRRARRALSKNNNNSPEDLDDENIATAVQQWLYNRSGALLVYGRIEEWDVSAVTHMWNLFKDASHFNDDISFWDVSCVTNMHGMFWGATEFNQPISFWNVQRVTTMYSMFRGAESFNQDLPWAAPNLEDMRYMFRDATSFQGDLSSFYTSTVSNMQGTFQGISYNRDISMWDVSNVYLMTSMFEENPTFNGHIGYWNTKSLGQFSRMFFNATSFNQELCWKISSQKEPYNIESFQVFCDSQGSFDPKCVSEEIIYAADRRCTEALQEYAQSWIDFWNEICDAWNDFLAFWENCFGLNSDVAGTVAG